MTSFYYILFTPGHGTKIDSMYLCITSSHLFKCGIAKIDRCSRLKQEVPNARHMNAGKVINMAITVIRTRQLGSRVTTDEIIVVSLSFEALHSIRHLKLILKSA